MTEEKTADLQNENHNRDGSSGRFFSLRDESAKNIIYAVQHEKSVKMVPGAYENLSIGGYRIQTNDREVLVGGENVVIFVKHSRTPRNLAMKVRYRTSDTYLQRKILESLKIQTDAFKRSRFIEAIISCYQTEQFFVVVCAEATHGSLRRVIDSCGWLPMHYIKYYFACIASAIAILNKQFICHLDIKSQNVLIDGYGCPKLTDFGLASKTSREILRNNEITSMVYYPPERKIMNADVYEIKIDSWLLGYLLAEMLIADPGHVHHKFSCSVESGWEFRLCEHCRKPGPCSPACYEMNMDKYRDDDKLPDWVTVAMENLVNRDIRQRLLVELVLELSAVVEGLDCRNTIEMPPPSIKDLLYYEFSNTM